jgi:hypothetical protein
MLLPLPDAQGLADDVPEALCVRAVHGCELGFTQADVAALPGGGRRRRSAAGGRPTLTAALTPCPGPRPGVPSAPGGHPCMM